MIYHFILNIRAESLKSRRTNAFWLTLGGAAFIPFIKFLKLTGRPDVFVSKMTDDPWALFVSDNWLPAASLCLPVYVILVISLVIQIEYGNNTWKQVYTTPRSYADIFFSKFLVINSLIFSCIVLFTVLIVLSGYAVHAVNHDYTFLSRPVPWTRLITLAGKMYVSVLAIAAIQYWLSLYMKNFITPLGIGMALLIGGFMIQRWEHIAYYPYMHPVLVYAKNPGAPGLGNQAILNSVLGCVLVLALGFYSICVRKEKG